MIYIKSHKTRISRSLCGYLFRRLAQLSLVLFPAIYPSPKHSSPQNVQARGQVRLGLNNATQLYSTDLVYQLCEWTDGAGVACWAGSLWSGASQSDACSCCGGYVSSLPCTTSSLRLNSPCPLPLVLYPQQTMCCCRCHFHCCCSLLQHGTNNTFIIMYINY